MTGRQGRPTPQPPFFGWLAPTSTGGWDSNASFSSPIPCHLARVCCRRAFPISPPIYHAVPAPGSSASNAAQTVYVHLNRYSGRLTGQLYEIIHRVSTAEPSTSFILHSGDLSGEARASLEAQLASYVDLLPAKQDTAEYFANISRSTVVLSPTRQEHIRFQRRKFL